MYKKIKSDKKNNIHQLIIKNYILMSLTTLLICFALFIATLSVINYFYNNYSVDLGFEFNKFPKEEFDEINGKIIAPNGYFDVLDKDCNIIYSTNGGIKNKYSPDLLALVKDYKQEGYFESNSYLNEDGNMEYFVKFRKRIETPSEETSECDFVVFLDANYKVIMSNFLQVGTQLTAKDFNYLTGFIDQFEVSRYTYLTQNGEERSVIIYQNGVITQMNQKIVLAILVLSLVLLIVAFVVNIFLFSNSISKKVKKPLDSINFAINNMKNIGSSTVIEFVEPSEFADLSKNFNAMSEKLEESRMAEKELNNEKLKIIADISHDLKTPITAIVGYTRALSDGLIAPDDYKKYLDIIDEKANGLSILVNMFFDYCKMEYPNFALVLEKIDISEFMRTYFVEKYEQVVFNKNNVNFEIDIPDEKIVCDIDKIQFKRALDNIISNSIKHNDGVITILFRLEQKDGECTIFLGDNGKGIDKAVIKDIFKPFVVGDESRTKNHGTGLGLSITQKIIEKLRGSIKYIVGEGEFRTVFVIKLPLQTNSKEEIKCN